MFEKLKQIFSDNGLLSGSLAGFEFRESQLAMALAVGEALQEGKPLLVEAPTGIGKTLAYLVPAILSKKRVAVSTGTKNLQDQIFEKDIPFLRRHLDSSVKVICVKGRKNYLCRRRFLSLLKQPTVISMGADQTLKRIYSWYKTTSTGDRAEIEWLPDDSPLWAEISSSSDQCVGSECKYYKGCFITKLKQRASSCDLFIVNHHLFFADLSLKQDEFGAVLPGYEAVVFDEAHQLDNVATNYFGFELSLLKFLELVRDIRKELQVARVSEPERVNLKLEELEIEARKYFGAFDRSPGRKRLESFEGLGDLLELGGKICEKLNSLAGELALLESASPAFPACHRRTLDLTRLLETFMLREDPDLVYWYETRRRGVFLHASPINVSSHLEKLLFRKVGPVILTSATLAIGKDFSFIRQCLGIPENAGEIVLSSHFDFEKNLIVYVPRDIPEPHAPDFIAEFCKKVLELIMISQGRALILFTSYRNMEEAYRILSGKNLPYRLLMQGEKPKSTLLGEFKEDIHSVLLATGSFWEGVDVPGPSLSSVIIDKLPFEVPSDPVLVARLERLREEGKDPFWHYQVPQAVLSLKQGVGRLIRTVEDRGMVGIMDVRIWKKAYGRKFMASLPECTKTPNLDDVARFFRADSVDSFSRNGVSR